MDEGGGVSRARLTVLALWPAALVAFLLWPLLTRPGHLLARDLVFLPDHALTWSALGLGGSARAVPLDAVVAVLTSVLDGGVLARLAVPAILLVAAVGVMRAVPWVGTTGLLVAGGVAVWNPFVSERLALGQWALLSSYAALPWLVRALAREDAAPGRGWPGVLGWTALASLTPTGGCLALAAGVVSLRRRRSLPLVALMVLLQIPWVVAGVVGPASRVSDPAGVTVFAPDTESRWGDAVAVLGLGGIWDSLSEPASRSTALGPLTAVVVVVVMAVAARELHRRWPRPLTWWVLAGAGTAWALLLTTGPGRALARWLVEVLPAAGLLRDGQKLLVPAVLVTACAAGVVADRAARTVARWFHDAPQVVPLVVLPLVVVPVLLLPDGARLPWRTFEPVAYPAASFEVVDRLVREDPGLLATLPWRAYRRFEWGNGLTSSDPASRVLSTDVVVSDDLQVGQVLVEGESLTADRVQDALDRGGASALARAGVRWVLLYPDDPEAGRVDVRDLERVHADPVLELYAVPGAVDAPSSSVGVRVAVALAHGVPVTLLVGTVVLVVTRRLRAGRGRARHGGSRGPAG